MLRWFLDKPYTKAMYISAIATCVLTVITAIMTVTLKQNSKALEISAQALALQESSFRLQNRPRLIYNEPRLLGEAIDSSGKKYPHHIRLNIVNYGTVPAIDAKTVAEFSINGVRIFGTVIPENVYTQADPKAIQLYIPEEVFSMMTATQHQFRIKCITTYRGVIGDHRDSFQTGTEFKYYQDDGTIRPERIWTEENVEKNG